MKKNLEEKLMKSAKEEERVVDALLKYGVTTAERTRGDKNKNRLEGDIWFTFAGNIYSIELQVAEGELPKNGKHGKPNFTFSFAKLRFAGHNNDSKNCFHIFGNETMNKFMIFTKEFIDAEVTDGHQTKDVVLFAQREYAVLSPSGLAASGKCLGFGETLEKCVENFVNGLFEEKLNKV